MGGTIDIGFLEELIRIPSVTVDGNAVNRAVEAMRVWLSARGVFCSVETDETGRNVLYAATTPGKVHDFLLVTHLDVVPAPASLFEPRTDAEGRLHGRGAGDTKGNAVAIAQTLVNLMGKGVSVGAVFASDEETTPTGGGTPSPQLLLERGYVPRRLVMVGDVTGDGPRTLFTAEKGHAVVTLVAHGKGGHSSLAWEHDNPIPKLCAGYLHFKQAFDAEFTGLGPWRTYVSPTKIDGSPSVNSVPDVATMALSCRYVRREDYERVLALLQGTGLEVLPADPRKHRPPVTTDDGNPLVQRFLSVLRRRWPKYALGRMNAATDASRYAHLGLPTVIYGAYSHGAHADDEWVSLQDLAVWPSVLCEFLTEC